MTPADARTIAHETFDEQVALLRTLAQIPAPSGGEEQRVAFVASWLRAAGATRVEVDAAKNVLCWVSETPDVGVEVFSAHTDVVFDDLAPLPLQEEGGRLYAPGVGDDTANLVNMMLVTRWLLAHPEVTTGRSILVVANSCEEGLGNLRGTRALYERYGTRIASHVVFDTTLGKIVNQAVGSVRWRVSVDGPGGHSFANFGRPNAIVALARIVCELDALELPTEATTTHNVGVIEGGTTVNSIAAHAEMLYDLRSISADCLQAMREKFERIVSAPQPEGITVMAEVIGERPSGDAVGLVGQDALVRRACAAYREAGRCADVYLAPSSTDANIPLSRGIPAVCVGTVRGQGAHTRGEWIELGSLTGGLAVALAMMS